MEDLLARMKKVIELELSPHSISHRNADDEIMRTNVSKVFTTKKYGQDILYCIIKALTKTTDKFLSPPTVNFKLIPFRNYAIGRNGIAELIACQKTFLLNTDIISVVDGVNGDDIFVGQQSRKK